MINLILIGGGGHCKSCIEVIEHCAGYRIAGILDIAHHIGKELLGYPIIGTDQEISRLAIDHQFLIAIGHIKSADPRRRMYEEVKRAGGQMATIVSSKANISRHASIGEGSIVMHAAMINAATTIGVNCIVNTGANVEHDCRVGDHVHISTHAVLNGDCAVGNESFVGSNVVVLNGMRVGNNITIGAGAVVHKSLAEPGVYIGNSCRQLT